MKFEATIIEEGRITLPPKLIELWKLEEGDEVSFVIEDGVVTLEPIFGNPFARYAGALPAFKSVEEINAWIAEMRNGED